MRNAWLAVFKLESFLLDLRQTLDHDYEQVGCTREDNLNVARILLGLAPRQQTPVRPSDHGRIIPKRWAWLLIKKKKKKTPVARYMCSIFTAIASPDMNREIYQVWDIMQFPVCYYILYQHNQSHTQHATITFSLDMSRWCTQNWRDIQWNLLVL